MLTLFCVIGFGGMAVGTCTGWWLRSKLSFFFPPSKEAEDDTLRDDM